MNHVEEDTSLHESRTRLEVRKLHAPLAEAKLAVTSPTKYLNHVPDVEIDSFSAFLS